LRCAALGALLGPTALPCADREATRQDSIVAWSRCAEKNDREKKGMRAGAKSAKDGAQGGIMSAMQNPQTLVSSPQ